MRRHTRKVIGGLIGFIVLATYAECERQRYYKLLSYTMRLEAWRIKQEIACNAFLSGRSDTLNLEPPPSFKECG